METDTPNPGSSAPPHKSFARFVPHIIRILMGLMFLFFGLNGFFNFMPAPKEMPADVMTVLGGLMKGGYMQVVSGTEVFAGILLLVNRFVPLSLALIAPIVVGIITFHIYVAPATIMPGLVVAAMELYLAWAYRTSFKPMLAARGTPS